MKYYYNITLLFHTYEPLSVRIRRSQKWPSLIFLIISNIIGDYKRENMVKKNYTNITIFGVIEVGNLPLEAFWKVPKW